MKDTTNLKGKFLRWALQLQNYDYTIEYKAGINNPADALSRRTYDDEKQTKSTSNEPFPLLTLQDEPPSPRVAYHLTYAKNNSTTLNQTQVNSLDQLASAQSAYNQVAPLDLIQDILITDHEQIAKYQQEDPEFGPIYAHALDPTKLPEDNKLARKIQLESGDYLISDKVLFHTFTTRGKGPRENRLITQLAVPSILRDDLMRSYHDSQGHLGQERVLEALRLKFFWHRMATDVIDYVKSCDPCQTAKRHFNAKPAPLKPLPVPHAKLSCISIDILGPLTTTQESYRYILLIVDHFSKFQVCIALKDQTAQSIALALYDSYII